MNTLQYKNYVGSIEFSDNDGVYFGKVQGISSLISYEGATLKDLTDDFHAAVDAYLKLCDEENTIPEAPFTPPSHNG